ncbi:two pore domain potassium channel family protein [Candidatus Micrarchaeota archaeon]|nr:two pore domain potassium channel family protein [Candidatus Micrarchaeota archaeon]
MRLSVESVNSSFPLRIKFAFVILIAIWLGGAIVYHELEHWRWIDSLYFAAVTITTVGFGDHVPSTDLGKLFTIIYMFAGIAVAFYALMAIGQYYFEKRFEISAKQFKKAVSRLKR